MRLCSAARRASRSGISVTIHTKANPFSMYASCRHLLQGCRVCASWWTTLLTWRGRVLAGVSAYYAFVATA